MLLIYSHISSPRLQYISNFIFKELLGIEYEITIDSESFKQHYGPRINYSDAQIDDNSVWIKNKSLLFEELILPQTISCFEWNGTKAFYRSGSGDFPFDILAASFFLITRYEEYLPHEHDEYGRFDFRNSLAYKEKFLEYPLVNIWVEAFAALLSKRFPGIEIKKPAFQFIPTYDIDIAYSYKHKGIARNTGGFLKAPSLDRLRVLSGSKKDPFDSYDWMDKIHAHFKLDPVYFFLVAEKNSSLDKNILPYKDVMWRLIGRHAKKYTVGLHPSFQSHDDEYTIRRERAQLYAMMGQENIRDRILRSRQHYIRFMLPTSYQVLIHADITDDYSMGYGAVNGFRASAASSFFWYDLEKEEQTTLRVHPFCFMDANSFYEQKQTPEQSFDEIMHYYHQCKNVNGTLITIWHNNFLGTAKQFRGWNEVYERFITQVQQ